MAALVALVGYSFVSSITPGPNNLMLWASGTEFGFRRTLRHVVGTAVGIGAMALGVAAGLGALITTIPAIGFVLKLSGSIYLIYLGYQIAGARALERGTVARPLGVVQAAVFQLINPKAWIFALGAITTFRPPESPVLVGTVLVALTMMVVVVPTAALWAGAGGAMSRFMAVERTRRVVSLLLAGLLLATVAYVWI
jgi:threonine/homoserine/homoserine lactone efflux protein